MPAPESIVQLVEKFESQKRFFTSSGYNEARARMDFIDPLFVALGWDVYNRNNDYEAYKDVIVEDSLRVRSTMQAPDYSFRIGGQRVFFVEAKSPSQKLAGNNAHAFQTRQYGWWAKLPVSILTDFEELAVYDCRVKPQGGDNAKTGLLFYWRYESFEKQWDEIASLISREAVRQGSLHKYLESNKVKGRPVDEDFLATIESWRDALARNIAIRNASLTEPEVNEITQRTIDRIVFLRNVQDRGIEENMPLESLLKGDRVWDRLRNFFYTADDKYNSGLFHFQIPGKPAAKNRTESPDTLTAALTIDDKVIKDIVRGFTYPTHYNFDLISAEILGQVYERFLGKVIRLTKGHRAMVEEKPEVRKAGGVYYTPEYIVRYIVEQTVGKLCEGRTLPEIAALRILDPACGSGSFLLGAFEYLMNIHLNWYVENLTPLTRGSRPSLSASESASDARRVTVSGGSDDTRRVTGSGGSDPFLKQRNNVPAIIQTYSNAQGLEVWTLTIEEKRRILLNNIYGVDIDPQAVEVTKLSLLLKLMEDAKSSDTNRQTKSHDRVLPDLGANIKCGNSLIGSDFYSGNQFEMLTKEESRRINVFDWDREWPEIMGRGGFDAVIGNPPYVRQEMLGDFKAYFQTHYQTYAGTADLYTYFIERGHTLLREGGRFGMICSNKFMRANYGAGLREFLSSTATIDEIIDFGELPVFKDAATFPVILITRNEKVKDHQFTYAPIKRLDFGSLEDEVAAIGNTLDKRSIAGYNWTLADTKEIEIFEKMNESSVHLGSYVGNKLYRGVLTGYNKAFIIDSQTRVRLIQEDENSERIIKPFAVGDDIRKYHINLKDKYLIFTRRGIDIKQYPAIEKHLLQYKEALTPKPKGWKGESWKGRKPGAYQWYEIQDTVDYYELLDRPKIIYPDIAKESRMFFDDKGIYIGNTIYFMSTDRLDLLAILNSKLLFFYFKRAASVLGDADKGGRLRWFSQDVVKLPIKLEKQNQQISSLVSRMLSLHTQLSSARTDFEQTNLRRQIAATDKEIDRLVYELYGLTENEIKIVEGR